MKTTEQMSHMGGTIAELDPQGRKVTINSLILNKTFRVADDAEIITPSKKHAALKDLKVGEPVEVTYEQHEPVCLAHRLDEVSAIKHQKSA
jgi:hypothetical protein